MQINERQAFTLSMLISANRQIFYTSPVSFIGLKTASIYEVFYVFAIYLGM